MDKKENDLDPRSFFEQALKMAEEIYKANPQDADNLTRWAGTLLELSPFQSISNLRSIYNSKEMIKDAISKMEEAVLINPEKRDAIWYTSQASDYFQQAVKKDLTNELYLKSLKINVKAPEHGLCQLTGGGPSGSSDPKAPTSSSLVEMLRQQFTLYTAIAEFNKLILLEQRLEAGQLESREEYVYRNVMELVKNYISKEKKRLAEEKKRLAEERKRLAEENLRLAGTVKLGDVLAVIDEYLDEPEPVYDTSVFQVDSRGFVKFTKPHNF